MGIGEEMYEDALCAEAGLEDEEDEGLWITVDGKVIEIQKMSDAHLLNAQRLMNERGHGGKSELLLEEIKSRGLNPLPKRNKTK